MSIENRENSRVPDIKIDELLALVRTLQYKHTEQFEYNGTGYLLLFVTKDEMKTDKQEGGLGLDAEYSKSTLINGYDIYVYSGLKGQDRERKLFHEILEANLQDQNFSTNEAHDIALSEEVKIYGER
jgi:hypothetical protein